MCILNSPQLRLPQDQASQNPNQVRKRLTNAPTRVYTQVALNGLSGYHMFLKEKEGQGEESEGSAWEWTVSKYIVCLKDK